jgi:hypothetical protein
MIVLGDRVDQRVQQTGFADARFSGQQYCLPAPRPGLLPCGAQRRQFSLATDHRCCADTDEPAPAQLFAQHAEQWEGVVMSLQQMLATASTIKPVPSRRRVPSAITTSPFAASACSRAARFGVVPTTACSRAGPFADQITHYDQSGGDSHSGGKLPDFRARHFANRFHDG